MILLFFYECSLNVVGSQRWWRHSNPTCCKKQECIPVGCVPPAHWSYLRISSYPMHPPLGATTHAPPEQPCMPPQSNHACPPWEQPRTPPWSNHACPPEQPCMPPGATTHTPQSNHATMHAPLGATMHAPPQEQPRMPPSNHARPPPVNRVTNWCKNITLPQTSFAGGN